MIEVPPNYQYPKSRIFERAASLIDDLDTSTVGFSDTVYIQGIVSCLNSNPNPIQAYIQLLKIVPMT